MNEPQAIEIAVELIGGPSALAVLLGLSPSAISQWMSGNRKTPPDRCPSIEMAASGRVTCEELRPDVRWQRFRDPDWPHPDGRPCIDVVERLTPGAP